MLLNEEQKNMFFNESIEEKTKESNQRIGIRAELANAARSFLNQFGIPYPHDMIQFNFKPKTTNGYYSVNEKNIYLCPQSIGSNNFQYFHTLIHESTHLIQYFLVENGISRNTIGNIDLDDYTKMCRKFYHNKSIIVTQEMLDKFKHFVKNEPFFENEKMKYIVQDILKYINAGSVYFNNVGEIMANDFATKELISLLKEHTVTPEQSKQIRECMDKDEKKIDKIKPQQKRLTSILQNIFTLPQNHIRHIVALSKMKLSPFVSNVHTMIDNIRNDASENAKDVKMYIKIETQVNNEMKKETIQQMLDDRNIKIIEDEPNNFVSKTNTISINDFVDKLLSVSNNIENVVINLNTFTIYELRTKNDVHSQEYTIADDILSNDSKTMYEISEKTLFNNEEIEYDEK